MGPLHFPFQPCGDRPAHLHRLVDVSNVLCLHKCMLLARANQLGKGSQKPLNADSAHLHVLSRHQRCQHGGEGKIQSHASQLACAPQDDSRLPVLVTRLAARTTIVTYSLHNEQLSRRFAHTKIMQDNPQSTEKQTFVHANMWASTSQKSTPTWVVHYFSSNLQQRKRSLESEQGGRQMRR